MVVATVLAECLLGTQAILPIETPSCLTFSLLNATSPLIELKSSTPIIVGNSEWPGVYRAATDLAQDWSKTVGGGNLSIWNITAAHNVTAETAIIVATLGRSELAAALADAALEPAGLAGSWEAYAMRHVRKPLPGIDNALVILGSDKRGSIYGLYSLAEELGVSPWWWWADVQPTKRDAAYLKVDSTCDAASPTVKYRGIFLNDEQPALTNWANEKFQPPGADLPTFRADFYSRVFELLLRLKANYLWPAMWAGMFYVDDPDSGALAAAYGIVMGTSHQEPMMRSTPNEWSRFGNGSYDYQTNAANIEAYWTEGVRRSKDWEGIYTVGMRGAGDLPLTVETNVELLDNIIGNQTAVLQNVFNRTDVEDIPQMWCLYQEVANYYYQGLRVPDYVTLLWADDNWGNLQRLPTDAERERTGGAGIYYHFDFVGAPRDYKWINTVSNIQTWQQMNLAYEYNATRIWIVNVGDLKPLEVPIDFFLSQAYNATAFTLSDVSAYQTRWALREFKDPDLAPTIADLVMNYTHHNARRKLELINSTTWSLINYHEAERVLSSWSHLVNVSQTVYDALPAAIQPSFFQLVLHPIKASATVNALWIAQGRNYWLSTQASNAANYQAALVEQLYEEDQRLADEYHTLNDGAWNHFMDQTHLSYVYWQQPMKDFLPPVSKFHPAPKALASNMRITLEGSHGAWPGDNWMQCSQGYNCPPPTLPYFDTYGSATRYIEVSSGGPNAFAFNVSTNASWARLALGGNTVSPNDTVPNRFEVGVDWSTWAGNGLQTGRVTISSSSGETQDVIIQAARTGVPPDFTGHVEGDGVVAIDAPHQSRQTAVSGIQWQSLLGFGRTLGAITPMPGLSSNFSAGSGPSVEYDFWIFNVPNAGNSTLANLTTVLFPGYNFMPDRPLKFAVAIDDEAPQILQPIPTSVPGTDPRDWSLAVSNAARTTVTSHQVASGKHTLKVWMIEPGVVLERFVLDVGGVRDSYLGPPESFRL